MGIEHTSDGKHALNKKISLTRKMSKEYRELLSKYEATHIFHDIYDREIVVEFKDDYLIRLPFPSA